MDAARIYRAQSPWILLTKQIGIKDRKKNWNKMVDFSSAIDNSNDFVKIVQKPTFGQWNIVLNTRARIAL
jgi:hypothetical protein